MCADSRRNEADEPNRETPGNCNPPRPSTTYLASPIKKPEARTRNYVADSRLYLFVKVVLHIMRKHDQITYFFSAAFLLGITRFSTIPMSVESATPPSAKLKLEPIENWSVPPPIPITRITEEIVRFLLS